MTGCSNLSGQSHPTVAPLNPTELFRLRSECAAMGEKILDRHIRWDHSHGGHAHREEDAGFDAPGAVESQVSHYDAVSNRCFVKLQSEDATEDWVYLFDGQSGEELAYTATSSSKQPGDPDAVKGAIRDHDVLVWPSLPETHPYNRSASFINQKMKDDLRN